MPDFKGLTVAAFESRMRLPMERLIEKYGGKPMVAPSMKEIPLENNEPAYAFYERLKKGGIDLFILMTGVGTRTFLSALEIRHPKDEILQTLSTKTKIVVRGPKPRAVCKMHNLPIAVTVPEPNTWREILSVLTEAGLLADKKVALLEHGGPNPDLVRELASQGAQVETVQVYKWALPDDLEPLNQAIDAIIAGQVDFALFTSANQVEHVLKVVARQGKEAAFRRALYRIGIGSIGPVCSEALRERQLFPDMEATPNKMDNLVEQAAQQAPEIIQRKRARSDGIRNNRSPLLQALKRQPAERVPIWLMRQAGRYMAEYQTVRAGRNFMDLCKSPDLATQATLDAVERLGVDAAIIFSDILLIVEPMGLKLEYKEGIGPLISNPVRTRDAVDALKPVSTEESLGFLLQAILQVRKNLNPHLPLLGFSGAPFTLAAYMIEGRGSKDYLATKSFMHAEPEGWKALLKKITQAHIGYLNAQIQAGVQAVQVFDSWAGALTAEEYREFALPYTQKLIRGIKPGVPVIHFATGASHFLELLSEAGGDVISVDWRTDLQEAWRRIGPDKGIQGNLDPTLLFSKPEVFIPEAEKILKGAGSRPGFIFNLGHGILPETPVEHVMALVDFVKEWKIR